MPVAHKTQESERRELKEAYIDAVKISGVAREHLKTLHQVSDNVLDKWLYVPDRFPSFKACWELYMFIRSARFHPSPLLERIISRSRQRAFDVARRLLENKGEIGEKINSADRYILNGELVSAKDAFASLGFSTANYLHTVIVRQGILAGEDISHIRSKRTRGRPKNGYQLNGRNVSIKDICELNNAAASTVRWKIKANRIKLGDDISGIDFSRSNSPEEKNKKAIENK
jgi:hypothetical protein